MCAGAVFLRLGSAFFRNKKPTDSNARGGKSVCGAGYRERATAGFTTLISLFVKREYRLLRRVKCVIKGAAKVPVGLWSKCDHSVIKDSGLIVMKG